MGLGAKPQKLQKKKLHSSIHSKSYTCPHLMHFAQLRMTSKPPGQATTPEIMNKTVSYLKFGELKILKLFYACFIKKQNKYC